MQRISLLQMFAITIHLTCFIYACCNDQFFKTIDVKQYVVGLNLLNENNKTHFVVKDTLSVAFPSVVFLHGLVALITACFHILLYTPIYYQHYVVVCNQEFFAVRWLEYAFTCTLMTLSSIVSSGPTTMNALIVIFLSGVNLQIVGFLIEQLKFYWKYLLIVGILLQGGLSWNIVWYNITGEGNIISWIEIISYVFYYSLFPLNCILNASKKIPFFVTDWIYNILSLSSKLALFWLQVGEVDKNINNTMWSYIQIYMFGITLPFIILLLGIYFRPQSIPTQHKDSHMNFYKKIATFHIKKEVQIIQIVRRTRIRPQ